LGGHQPFGCSQGAGCRKREKARGKGTNRPLGHGLMLELAKAITALAKYHSERGVFASSSLMSPLINTFPVVSGLLLWLSSVIVFVLHRFTCLLLSARARSVSYLRDHSIPNRWPEKVNRKVHPHIKPINLIGRLIAATTEPGDLVVDPAAGSFAVMHAARQLGRDFIGCDLVYDSSQPHLPSRDE
jgi:hypothetical protein